MYLFIGNHLIVLDIMWEGTYETGDLTENLIKNPYKTPR